MELTQSQLRQAVRAVQEGIEPPRGPILSTFEPLSLALAIEQEHHRVANRSRPGITITMDSPDALLLVMFLLQYGVHRVSDTWPQSLALAIENECKLAEDQPDRKIVINMDLQNALMLVKCLRGDS